MSKKQTCSGKKKPTIKQKKLAVVKHGVGKDAKDQNKLLAGNGVEVLAKGRKNLPKGAETSKKLDHVQPPEEDPVIKSKP
ncbi:MAG: hypothetical protein GY816_14070 [Cytophagales bacterium]|nr:hypothetical protein [Cytophagales bacterium]